VIAPLAYLPIYYQYNDATILDTKGGLRIKPVAAFFILGALYPDMPAFKVYGCQEDLPS
jgi:hypothetical protein